jgi:aspartyl/asparaginyl beta-hydroxylase (cupin superfamily)
MTSVQGPEVPQRAAEPPTPRRRRDVLRASDWLQLPILVAGFKLSTLLIKRAPGGETRVFDNQVFPWLSSLEDHWQGIREEALAAAGDSSAVPRMRDVLPMRYRVPSEWRAFFFYGYGRRVERNCRACPVTSEALLSIPGLQTAFYSILPPHSRLASHVGIYRGVLRFHLGLVIPDPDRCALRIENRVLRWQEGRSFVFCDQYEHEAWNDSDRDRLILFADFVRPLPPFQDALNRWVIRAISRTRFIQEGQENLERFDGVRASGAVSH